MHKISLFRDFVTCATPESARDAISEVMREAAQIPECVSELASAAAQHGSGAYRMYVTAIWPVDVVGDCECLEWAMMYSLANVHCRGNGGATYDPDRQCPLIVNLCRMAGSDRGVAVFLRGFVERNYEASSLYLFVLSMFSLSMLAPPLRHIERTEKTRAALTVPFDKMVMETIVRMALKLPPDRESLRMQPVLVRLIFMSGSVRGILPLLSLAFGAQTPLLDPDDVMYSPDFINGYKHAHDICMRLVNAACAIRCCGCGMPPCTSGDQFEALEQMTANPHSADTRCAIASECAAEGDRCRFERCDK